MCFVDVLCARCHRGNSHGWGRGAGSGPWVMADLENGLWAGNEKVMPQPPLVADFVTAMVKGNSGNQFALKGGDAQTGPLKKLYEGVRPDRYHPVRARARACVLGCAFACVLLVCVRASIAMPNLLPR